MELAGYTGATAPPLMPLAADAKAQIGAELARLQELA